jgi:hypothetical protein
LARMVANSINSGPINRTVCINWMGFSVQTGKTMPDERD